MKRVVLLTNHFLESRNKAGFHWLADAFWTAGWEVLFFTESISWISWLRRDSRFAYPLFRQAGKLRQVQKRLWSYVWLTPFHPVNWRNRLLNRISQPLLSAYGQFSFQEAEAMISGADLFIFDSDHGLFLFDRIKQLNPRARFVYRVSDDLPTMKHHPGVLKHEQSIAKSFDLVSAPSMYIQRRLSAHAHVELHRHALQRELFDRPCANPYRTNRPNVLFVGRNRLDYDFVNRAVALFPDWSFHLFGGVLDRPRGSNLIVHGERPFAELIPYLRYADIGLQSLEYWPGAECFTDSLKMQQYTYCRLPIVAPTFLRTAQPHVFYYEPGDDESIRGALLAASRFDRAKVPHEQVGSWSDLIVKLAGHDMEKAHAA